MESPFQQYSNPQYSASELAAQKEAARLKALAYANQNGYATQLGQNTLNGFNDWYGNQIKEYMGSGSGSTLQDNFQGFKPNDQYGSGNQAYNELAKQGITGQSFSRENSGFQAMNDYLGNQGAAYEADPTKYIQDQLNKVNFINVGKNDNNDLRYDRQSGQLVDMGNHNTDDTERALGALAMFAAPLGLAAAGVGAVGSGIGAATLGGQTLTPALMESAMGSAGYGASSASGLLGAGSVAALPVSEVIGSTLPEAAQTLTGAGQTLQPMVDGVAGMTEIPVTAGTGTGNLGAVAGNDILGGGLLGEGGVTVINGGGLPNVPTPSVNNASGSGTLGQQVASTPVNNAASGDLLTNGAGSAPIANSALNKLKGLLNGEGSLSDYVGAAGLLSDVLGIGGVNKNGGAGVETKAPWSVAQPYIQRGLADTAALNDKYKANPFSADQLKYQGQYYADADKFRNTMLPQYMNFANLGMTGGYQRGGSTIPGKV